VYINTRARVHVPSNTRAAVT